KDLYKLVNIINSQRPVSVKTPIVLSLVGACTTKLCKFVKSVSKIGVFPKSISTSLREDSIIDNLKENKKILPLFIPLRPQSFMGLRTSNSNPVSERSSKEYHNLQQLINVSSTENIFKSIVDIAEY